MSTFLLSFLDLALDLVFLVTLLAGHQDGDRRTDSVLGATCVASFLHDGADEIATDPSTD